MFQIDISASQTKILSTRRTICSCVITLISSDSLVHMVRPGKKKKKATLLAFSSALVCVHTNFFLKNEPRAVSVKSHGLIGNSVIGQF